MIYEIACSFGPVPKWEGATADFITSELVKQVLINKLVNMNFLILNYKIWLKFFIFTYLLLLFKVPIEKLPERRQWRDTRLAGLAKLKKQMGVDES